MIANQISEFSWGLAVQQLANATANRPEPTRRFNPRPPGVIQTGSATDAVLAFLEANPRRYFSNGELMRVTGRSHAAVSWSLMFLRHQGLIEAAPDEYRNKKYMRYAWEQEVSNARRSEPRTEASQTSLANDEAPLPGAGVPVVRKVRRKRNSDLSTVDGLSPVSERHGSAAEPGALAGSARYEQALHTRQLPVDNAQGADGTAPVLQESVPGWKPSDRCGGGTNSGPGQKHGAPKVGEWAESDVEGREPIGSKNRVDCLAGRQPSVGNLGQTPGPALPNAEESNQARYGTGASNDFSKVRTQSVQRQTVGEHQTPYSFLPANNSSGEAIRAQIDAQNPINN